MEPKLEEKNFAVTIYQAKAILGNVHSEMKPDEIRKFKFVYQNSGDSPWLSGVKLIRVSGDLLGIEFGSNQNEVKSCAYFMI